MADYGNYNSGTGDVISAIQRPALDVEEERQKALANVQALNQQMAQQAQLAPYQQANDLVNQAIAARQNIEKRRFDLERRLEGANKHQAVSIGAQIEGLDRASHGLMQDAALQSRLRMDEADQRRMLEHEQASFAARALKTDRESSIDEQGAALMTGLGRLDALHRNGNISDEQFDNHLLDLGQQYGLGLRHPDAGKMFEHYVGEADRRNQFNLRRTAAEAARVGARYGVDVQTGEDGLPSIEATKQAALQTPRGKSEFLKQMNDELYQKYGNPLGVGSLFNPIAPHTSDDEGKTINLPFTDKQGKEGKLKVPMETFNQMKADFQDRYFSVFPPAETPAGSATPTQQQAAGGIQAGATRTVGGVNYTWNGTRWEQQ